jgi:hypothetical protein
MKELVHEVAHGSPLDLGAEEPGARTAGRREPAKECAVG